MSASEDTMGTTDSFVDSLGCIYFHGERLTAKEALDRLLSVETLADRLGHRSADARDAIARSEAALQEAREALRVMIDWHERGDAHVPRNVQRFLTDLTTARAALDSGHQEGEA